MKKLSLVVSAILLFTACSKPGSSGGSRSGAAPSSEDDKTLYALGLLAGRPLTSLKLSPQEMDMVQRGIGDAASGATPEVALDVYGPKVQQFARARSQAAAAAAAAVEKEKAGPYLDAASKETGAEKTASGLVYKELTPGTGDSPKPTDRVKVNYEGKLVDGTVFDSSYKRGQPTTFGLNQVVPCWTEGLSKMKVGGASQLICPSSIAYGDTGHPPTIPGGAVLTFKVELISIEPPAAVPPPGAVAPHPGMMAPNGRPMMQMGPGGRPMNVGVGPRPAPMPAPAPASK